MFPAAHIPLLLSPAVASSEPNLLGVLIWLSVGAIAVISGIIIVSVLRRRSDLITPASHLLSERESTGSIAVVRAA